MIGFDVTDRTRRARGEEIGVAVAARREQGEQRPKIMLPPKPLPVLAEQGGVRSLDARLRIRERAREPDRLSDRRDREPEILAPGTWMESRRFYRQFCMMARTLEVVGERWSLLIVRDLLLGPRRFTDLQRGLAEITPTRLTDRLRQLQAAGVVTRERRHDGREVWYELTSAGRALEPIVDALTLWGIEHAFEAPRPDEPVCAAPVMIGTKVLLRRNLGSPDRPIVWAWRFAGDHSYTIRGDRAGWTLQRDAQEGADVIVETTLETWALLLTARGQRKLPHRGIELRGEPTALAKFARAFSANASANRARRNTGS